MSMLKTVEDLNRAVRSDFNQQAMPSANPPYHQCLDANSFAHYYSQRKARSSGGGAEPVTTRTRLMSSSGLRQVLSSLEPLRATKQPPKSRQDAVDETFCAQGSQKHEPWSGAAATNMSDQRPHEMLNIAAPVQQHAAYSTDEDSSYDICCDCRKSVSPPKTSLATMAAAFPDQGKLGHSVGKLTMLELRNHVTDRSCGLMGTEQHSSTHQKHDVNHDHRWQQQLGDQGVCGFTRHYDQAQGQLSEQQHVISFTTQQQGNQQQQSLIQPLPIQRSMQHLHVIIPPSEPSSCPPSSHGQEADQAPAPAEQMHYAASQNLGATSLNAATAGYTEGYDHASVEYQSRVGQWITQQPTSWETITYNSEQPQADWKADNATHEHYYNLVNEPDDNHYIGEQQYNVHGVTEADRLAIAAAAYDAVPDPVKSRQQHVNAYPVGQDWHQQHWTEQPMEAVQAAYDAVPGPHKAVLVHCAAGDDARGTYVTREEMIAATNTMQVVQTRDSTVEYSSDGQHFAGVAAQHHDAAAGHFARSSSRSIADSAWSMPVVVGASQTPRSAMPVATQVVTARQAPLQTSQSYQASSVSETAPSTEANLSYLDKHLSRLGNVDSRIPRSPSGAGAASTQSGFTVPESHGAIDPRLSSGGGHPSARQSQAMAAPGPQGAIQQDTQCVSMPANSLPGMPSQPQLIHQHGPTQAGQGYTGNMAAPSTAGTPRPSQMMPAQGKQNASFGHNQDMGGQTAPSAAGTPRPSQTCHHRACRTHHLGKSRIWVIRQYLAQLEHQGKLR
eukprot:jgi/Chrzof1/4384/Cz14g11050.t1